MPRSRAIRRASGEALTRPPSRRGSRGVACGLGGLRPRRRGRARAPARAPAPSTAPRRRARTRPSPAAAPRGTDSPSAPTNAIVCPTGTSPSRDRDLQQHAGGVGLDLLGDLVGVELVERLALLDLSPSDLSQRTIVPDSMPCPRRGSLTSAAIATRPCGGSPRARRLRAGRPTPPSPARTGSARTSRPRARSARPGSRRRRTARPRRPRRRSPSASPPRARRRSGSSS